MYNSIVIILLILVVIIRVLIKYNPRIDFVKRGDKILVFLWYNKYGEKGNRRYIKL